MTNNNQTTSQDTKSSGRGFAGMDSDLQREIASKGGQSQGKESNLGNFANNPERASEAGRKGGSSPGAMNTRDEPGT